MRRRKKQAEFIANTAHALADVLLDSATIVADGHQFLSQLGWVFYSSLDSVLGASRAATKGLAKRLQFG
jgi:hypothetical protein